MPQLKQCGACQSMKDVTAFHKDKTSSDGLSYSCAACRNASKKRKAAHRARQQAEAAPEPVQAPPPPAKVARPKGDAVVLLKRITEKYQSHYSLSVARDGKCRLQVHREPTLTFKDTDLRSLLEKVAA